MGAAVEISPLERKQDTQLASIDFWIGSRLFSNSGLGVKLSVDAPVGFTVLSAVGAGLSA